MNNVEYSLDVSIFFWIPDFFQKIKKSTYKRMSLSRDSHQPYGQKIRLWEKPSANLQLMARQGNAPVSTQELFQLRDIPLYKKFKVFEISWGNALVIFYRLADV